MFAARNTPVKSKPIAIPGRTAQTAVLNEHSPGVYAPDSPQFIMGKNVQTSPTHVQLSRALDVFMIGDEVRGDIQEDRFNSEYQMIIDTCTKLYTKLQAYIKQLDQIRRKSNKHENEYFDNILSLSDEVLEIIKKLSSEAYNANTQESDLGQKLKHQLDLYTKEETDKVKDNLEFLAKVKRQLGSALYDVALEYYQSIKEDKNQFDLKFGKVFHFDGKFPARETYLAYCASIKLTDMALCINQCWIDCNNTWVTSRALKSIREKIPACVQALNDPRLTLQSVKKIKVPQLVVAPILQLVDVESFDSAAHAATSIADLAHTHEQTRKGLHEINVANLKTECKKAKKELAYWLATMDQQVFDKAHEQKYYLDGNVNDLTPVDCPLDPVTKNLIMGKPFDKVENVRQAWLSQLDLWLAGSLEQNQKIANPPIKKPVPVIVPDTQPLTPMQSSVQSSVQNLQGLPPVLPQERSVLRDMNAAQQLPLQKKFAAISELLNQDWSGELGRYAKLRGQIAPKGIIEMRAILIDDSKSIASKLIDIKIMADNKFNENCCATLFKGRSKLTIRLYNELSKLDTLGIDNDLKELALLDGIKKSLKV